MKATRRPSAPKASAMSIITDAAPGSTRKISVLTERAARREALFHPQDNLKRILPNAVPEPDPIEDESEDMEIEAELVG